jgi:hypothetical protein
MLYAPGESCTTFKLLPEDKFRDFQLPARDIPKPQSHHREWLEAIRTRTPPMANFEYGAILTEALLLGNVALRNDEKKALQWDRSNMRFTNWSGADRYIKGEYRKGWEL